MAVRKTKIALKSLRREVDRRIKATKRGLARSEKSARGARKAKDTTRAGISNKSVTHAQATLRKLETVQKLLMSCCCTASQNCEFEI